MESEHFAVVGTRRVNRRHCAILVHCKTGNPVGPSLALDLGNSFEVLWPWSGPLHYGDKMEGYPALQAELTSLIESYTK